MDGGCARQLFARRGRSGAGALALLLLLTQGMAAAPAAARPRSKGFAPEAVERLQDRSAARQVRLPWTDFQQRTYRRGEPIVLCAGFGDVNGEELQRPPSEEAFLLARLISTGPPQSIALQDDGLGADLRAHDGVFCNLLRGLVRPERYRIVLLPRNAPGYDSRTLEFSLGSQAWLEVHHPREQERVAAGRPLLVEVLLRGRLGREGVELQATFLGDSERTIELGLQPAGFPGLYAGELGEPLTPGPWRIRIVVRGRTGESGRFEEVSLHHFEVAGRGPGAGGPDSGRGLTEEAGPAPAATPPGADGHGRAPDWGLLLGALGCALALLALLQGLLGRRSTLRDALSEALAETRQAEGRSGVEEPPLPLRTGPLLPPPPAGLSPLEREELIAEVMRLARAQGLAGGPGGGSVRPVEAAPTTGGQDPPSAVARPEQPGRSLPQGGLDELPARPGDLDDDLLFGDLLAGNEADSEVAEEEMVSLDQADIDSLVASMAVQTRRPVRGAAAGNKGGAAEAPGAALPGAEELGLLDRAMGRGAGAEGRQPGVEL